MPWRKETCKGKLFRSHGSPVTSLAELADRRLVSGGRDDGTIKLWPKEGSMGEPVVLAHGSKVNSLAVWDGRLASVSADDKDGAIKVWRKDGASEPLLLPGASVKSLAVLKNRRLASGIEYQKNVEARIKLWPKYVKSEPFHPQDCSVFALAEWDGLLASSDYCGVIRLWREDGTEKPIVLDRELYRYRNNCDQLQPVIALVVLPDGRLASSHRDGTIRLWRPKVGEPVELHNGPRITDCSQWRPWQIVYSLAVWNGRLASGDRCGNVKLWHTDTTGEPPQVLTHHSCSPESPTDESSVRSLTVLADGRLASGGSDGDIKLWRWPKDTGDMKSDRILLDGTLPKPGAEELTAQPDWVFFVAWAELVKTKNSPQEIGHLYESRKTLTLDELPGWR